MQSYEQILRGGVGLFAASIDVNRFQWRQYVNSLQVKEAYPGVKGIGFAPVIAHDEKAEHLAKLWQEGFTDYKILPQGDRSTYTPVLFREPLDGLSRRVLGFDMMSEPIRRKAMERARDTGAAALTGKVQAVVENEAQNSASVVMVLPVYDHNTSPFSLDSRRAALKGYVFASFRVSELIEATLGERLAEIGIDLEVFESVAIANETMLYQRDDQSHFTDAKFHPLFTSRQTLELGGQPWTLSLQTLPLFENSIDRSQSWLILGGGALLSLLLLGFLYSLATQHANVKERASQLTQDLQQSEERFRHLAHHDPLTGLPNRVLLQDQGARALARARRNKNYVGILFIDLDRFKTINDSLGHSAGDALLREVADRIRRTVRNFDTVARMGGDEFVVLLSDLVNPAAAGSVAQHLLESLAKVTIIDGHHLHVTPSIGVSVFPSDATDFDELLKHADAAMYLAKDNGRNGYRFFTSEINTLAHGRLAVETGLRHALQNGELELHYQPQIAISSGAIVGAEVLLRWRNPQRGLVAPDDFIPIAEDTGLIVPIGEWVLRTACAQYAKWRQRGLAPFRLAINLSARQLRQKDLADVTREILVANSINGEVLELEITETGLMQNTDEAAIALRGLKALGIRLSLDDFGTGYSSLSNLRRFPIDCLKIDRSFIRDISTDPGDAVLVRAIIDLAHSLGMTIVAEGVETLDQLRFLHLHNCDDAQGFFISKPLPAEAFAHAYTHWQSRSARSVSAEALDPVT
ncbi:MAG: EAL domain-containing protein [Pseudomonadota bacterium]|nr:EAL domain-containing protein [Pseudomonadota bacterium]